MAKVKQDINEYFATISKDPVKFAMGKENKKINGFQKQVRFWAEVDKDGPEHPTLGKCWVWTGRTINSGYGDFVGGLVHRYSWRLHRGEIENGLFVLHECDNQICVNPSHLFLGTQQDNLADMRRKGNQVRGEAQGNSKLTEEQVREIKRRYKRYSHKHGSGALAKEFGVCVTQIWRIAVKGDWAHVQ